MIKLYAVVTSLGFVHTHWGTRGIAERHAQEDNLDYPSLAPHRVAYLVERDQELDSLVADVVHCAAQLAMCDFESSRVLARGQQHKTEAETWKANLRAAILELDRICGIPETLTALGHQKGRT